MINMKISEVKKKYKNKWVLVEVLKENKLNQPVEVKPIIASKERNEVYEGIAKVSSGATVATVYTGKATGVYIFHVNSKV